MPEAIPGTFIDPATNKLRWIRTQDLNGRGLVFRRYHAECADGLLSAVVGQEPAGTGGRMLWHISVAHRQISGDSEKFIRCPTWDELKHAKYTLCPANVPMVIIFPRRGVPYANEYPTALHIWETEDAEIDR